MVLVARDWGGACHLQPQDPAGGYIFPGIDHEVLQNLLHTPPVCLYKAFLLRQHVFNLQQTLARLEDVNAQLEKDVERERLLLAERKELVDSLSHEMQTG